MTGASGAKLDCMLLKVGPWKYMRRLWEKGEVFMRPVREYMAIENAQRGDRAEGAKVHISGVDIKNVSVEGINQPISWLSMHGDWVNNGIYCMCGLRTGIVDWDAQPPWIRRRNSGFEMSLDPAMREFGDWAVLMHQSNEFLTRLDAAASVRGIEMGHHVVTYLPESPSMTLGPYLKRDCFQHQGEIRFMTKTPISGALKLNLGSLRDIAGFGSW